MRELLTTGQAACPDYRDVLDALTDAMVAADGSNTIIYANAAAEALLGWPAAELIGQPLTVIMPPRHHVQHNSGFRRYVSSQSARLFGRVLRVPALHRDGSEIDVEITLSTLPSADGRQLIISCLRDLRERIEIERQLTVTRYLRATNNAMARLASLLDLDQVMAVVVETLVNDFDAMLARVWLLDRESNIARLHAMAGAVAPPSDQYAYDVATSTYPVAHVARTGQPLVYNGSAGARFGAEWASQYGVGAAVLFPLKVENEVWGVLSYCSRQALPDEVVASLSTFAAIVAASLRDVEQLKRERIARAAAEASAAEATAQARRLSLVQQTARGLAMITSVQQLCERLVGVIYERMGRHVVGVYLRDGDALDLVAHQAPNSPGVRAARRLPVGAGIVGHVAATNQPYLCRDTVIDPYFHRPSDVGTRAEVAVPISDGASLIGVLNVESATPGTFDDDDVTTLLVIADQAAIAIQNARLYEAEAELRQRAEQRARRIEHVQRVGERLKMNLNEQEVGARVVTAACEALDFRGAVLNLVDQPGDPQTRVRVVATSGLPPEGEAALYAHDFAIADVQALFRSEFKLSRSYFIPQEKGGVSGAVENIPVWTPTLQNEGPNAWRSGDELLVPLTDHEGGHLLGFLSVDDPESGQRPEREEVEVLEIFADQAVVALRNARLHAQARRQADCDPVTGLLNHRAAHARIEAEVAVAREAGQPLGVLTLDMDGFKLLNDTHGHPVGDMALRHIARLLEHCARATDVPARLGGDEFLLILPGASREDSIAVAQRLTGLAHDAPLDLDGVGPLPLRLSVGIATFPSDAVQVHALLGIADARLYEAKRAGGWSVEAGRDRRDGDARHGAPDDLAGFDMLSALVTAVDNKDRYTREHSEQVAGFACDLAAALGLSLDTQRTLRIAGLLHDVGKIGVPDRVLRKPGRLEPDEWEAMRQHVALSETLVRAVVTDPDILAAVAHHHERWDGRGYPRGLQGTEVPLLGRIMIVADAVSAMAMDRPYRRGLSCDVIVSELRKGAGTQFDPALVEPFIAACTLARDDVA